MNIKLAIVIPFYKGAFFQKLLETLASQTNKSFKVYVGNDCSPYDPIPILKLYQYKLNITYKSFEERLGHISLTKQWDRCVAMVKDEEWVWVLPDDDLPSINCVEEFYLALETPEVKKVNVFRFPLNIIDKNGKITKKAGEHPLYENNYDFYMRQLKGGDGSSLGDNIFRRSALERSGGFVDFPKAWGSDHATILNVAAGGLICCLQRTSLSFRMSGENISSDSTDGLVKLDAKVMFAKWLKLNESIFPGKLDIDFYNFFYWKAEYYIMNEWAFDFKLFIKLFELRKICFDSCNIVPVVKFFLKKTRSLISDKRNYL